MSSTKGWMWKGKAARDEATRDAQERKAAYVKGDLFAFYLKKGQTGQFICLDNPSDVFLRRHTVKTARDKTIGLTCTKQMDKFNKECAPCDELDGNVNTPQYIGTVISLIPYKTKSGQTIKASRKKLVVKGSNMKYFEQALPKHKDNLRFCKFEAMRGDAENSYNIGTNFQFLKRMKEADVLALKPKGSTLTDEEWLTSMDYGTVYAPKTPAEQRRLLGIRGGVGSQEDEDEAPGEEEGEDESPEGEDEDEGEGEEEGEEDEGEEESEEGEEEDEGEEEGEEDEEEGEEEPPPPKKETPKPKKKETPTAKGKKAPKTGSQGKSAKELI